MNSVHDPAGKARLTRRLSGLSRTSLGLTVGAVLIGCLTGCGSSAAYLNGAAVERSIASSFLHQKHVYTQVLCPNRIPQRQGHVFQCIAGFDVGHYTVPVIETNGTGHVRWSTRAPVDLLKIKKVSDAIRRSIRIQRGVSATVVCPARVLQQKGLVFRCRAVVRHGTVKVKAGTYLFTVTEADAAGHVTYVQG